MWPYPDFATNTLKPASYDLPAYVLDNTYRFTRASLMAVGKQRLATASALSVPATFRLYWNVAHDVIALLTTLLSIGKLRQWNLGMVAQSAYVTDAVIGQCSSYWNRLSAIRMPSALRDMAIKDGLPILGLYDRAIYLRQWALDEQPLHHTTGYTVSAAYPMDCLGVASLTTMMTNIDLGVQVLEGNPAAASMDDVTLILDLLQLSSYYDATKNVYTQGMPDWRTLPPYRTDPTALNDILFRGLFVKDTHGASADEKGGFPLTACTELSNTIPIMGKGEPGIEEFSLFGAAKGVILNSTADTYSTALTDEHLIFGCSLRAVHGTPPAIAATPVSSQSGGFATGQSIYTREDGWVSLSQNVDFGDASAIIAYLNSGTPLLKHTFSPSLWSGQLDASFELRFLDSLEADYIMYQPIEDLVQGHANTLASMFGVPGLLS
jgi:hypothetical protein